MASGSVWQLGSVAPKGAGDSSAARFPMAYAMGRRVERPCGTIDSTAAGCPALAPTREGTALRGMLRLCREGYLIMRAS